MTDRVPRVLYVDDGDDFLTAMRLTLENHGYEMIAAGSAEEGLRLWKEHRPDFILLDLMMEEIDAGKSLATELRARGNTAPVYLLSSVGDQVGRTTTPQEMGVDGIFQKPVDPRTLLATLEAKLGHGAA